MAGGRLAHLRGGSAHAEVAGAPAAAAAAVVGAALRRLLAAVHVRRGRGPVLPVRSKHKGSPPASRTTSSSWRRRAATFAALALLLATVALALYARSILHESPAAVAAAAAEAQAAVAAAAMHPVAAAAAAAHASREWAAAGPSRPVDAAAAAEGKDPLQPAPPTPVDMLHDSTTKPAPLLTAKYTVRGGAVCLGAASSSAAGGCAPASAGLTRSFVLLFLHQVVVMSYSKRLASLPTVINQLGGCPSAAEVLLVWNGAHPPAPALFSSRAPLRIRQEAAVGCIGTGCK